MKAVIIDGNIRVFSAIPNIWKNHINFPSASEEMHRSEGFYDLVMPMYDTATQKLGDIYFDNVNQIFTYQVINKTAEEIKMEYQNTIDLLEAELNIAALKRIIAILTKSIVDSPELTEGNIGDLAALYPYYKIDHDYKLGDILAFDGKLYKVLQNHTSQMTWSPDVSTSLYVRISEPGSISPWVQPTGAHDSYGIGDKVTHNGSTWESTYNNNTWEPGVFGWISIV